MIAKLGEELFEGLAHEIQTGLDVDLHAAMCLATELKVKTMCRGWGEGTSESPFHSFNGFLRTMYSAPEGLDIVLSFDEL